jgi:hypothetical protein
MVTLAVLQMAASPKLGEVLGEVLREIGIEHSHIAEYGVPMLIFAVAVGAFVAWSKD